MAETLAALLIDPGLITVINFSIYSLVLLWRPQGLFARDAGIGSANRSRFFRHLPAAAGLGLLLLAPALANAYWLSLMVNILMYVALATGWAFFSGATRYVSLAASAFFGVGAYAVAFLAPGGSSTSPRRPGAICSSPSPPRILTTNGAVRGHHCAVAHPRPQPAGLRAGHPGGRRNRGAPNWHQHG